MATKNTGGDNMAQKFELPNPGISFTWLIALLQKILETILEIVTPDIMEALRKFLLELYQKAKETANPWDDFLLRFLLRILGIPVPD